MTKYNAVDALCKAGIAHDDAIALRRISMTLHRWHELECGDGNDYASWCITRGNWAKAPERRAPRQPDGSRWPKEFIYDENGAAFEERHVHSENKARYTLIPDRERGALKRLAKIMERYPQFASYVQGDPRGASLYILDRATTPQPHDANYSRGIAVCQ